MTEKRPATDPLDNKDYSVVPPAKNAVPSDEIDESSSSEPEDDGSCIINWLSSWVETKASSYKLATPTTIKDIIYLSGKDVSNRVESDPKLEDDDSKSSITQPSMRIIFESGHYLYLHIVHESNIYFTPYITKYITYNYDEAPFTFRSDNINIVEGYGYSREEMASKPVYKIRVSKISNTYEHGICVRFMDNSGKYITYKPKYLTNPHPEYVPSLYMLNDMDDSFVFTSVSFHNPDGTQITSVGYNIGQIDFET